MNNVKAGDKVYWKANALVGELVESEVLDICAGYYFVTGSREVFDPVSSFVTFSEAKKIATFYWQSQKQKAVTEIEKFSATV